MADELNSLCARGHAESQHLMCSLMALVHCFTVESAQDTPSGPEVQPGWSGSAKETVFSLVSNVFTHRCSDIGHNHIDVTAVAFVVQ
jgi:hypothetical protein